MKKKIILHIGSQKTGTTSLIHFLHANHGRLEKAGFLFPRPWFEINPAQMVFVNEFAKPRFPELENPWLFQVPAETTLSEYRRAIGCSKADHAVFVGRFYSYRTDIDLGRLKAFLDGCEVTVIVYLRRQDQFAEAYFRQLLKRTLAGAGRFDEFIRMPALREWLDYRSSLRPWVETFGRENVIVRPYADNQLPRGTIHDFSEQTGLPVDDSFHMPARPEHTNTGLPATLLEFLRLVKQHPIDHRLRQRIEEWACRRADRFSHESPLYYFHPHERADFMSRFEDGNREIATELISRRDGVLFSERPGNDEETGIFYEDVMTAAKAEELLIDLCTALMETPKKRKTLPALARAVKINYLKRRWGMA